MTSGKSSRRVERSETAPTLPSTVVSLSDYFVGPLLILCGRFKKQFAMYLADEVNSEDLEEMYTSAYAKIRESPEHKPTDKDAGKWKSESKKYKQAPLNREQRRERVDAKIAAYKAGKADAADDEDDEAEEEEAEEDDE